MNTFYQMWGVITPIQAMEKIMQQRQEAGIINPQNLEEQAISLVGKDMIIITSMISFKVFLSGAILNWLKNFLTEWKCD